jgi:Mrp family chromosome partitioning ATPase
MAGNGSIETMPAVLASPMVQRLRESQARIEAELADLSASLLENHPRMRALRAQGEETARQLRAETARVLAATENEAATARGRESRLVAEVNRLKAASAQAGDDEVELRALEREAMAQRALLESYLTRHREAAARADRSPAPADARIFARAAAPSEAYFPRMMPILAAAFAGSLVVIAVLVLMRELFSGRAMRPAPGAFVERPAEDPQLWPQQPQDGIEPVLAVVAAEQEDESEEIERFAEEIAAGGEEDDEEDDVTMARNQPVKTTPGPEEITVAGIAGELVGSDVGRVVFISPEGDEATAVSVTVARTVADAGLRTLFLDLTWSGAPSAAMLEEEGRAGITDLLALRAKFADIIHGDVYSGCHVVPAGTVDPVEAMRAAERLPEILEALDDAYEVVIIECGAADAQTIAEVTSEDAEVLIGALDPRAKAVAGVAADLALLGYGEVLTVTPGARPARPGRRGRLAA